MQRGEGLCPESETSPEKLQEWESADPVKKGAGHAASAVETSTKPAPRGRRWHRAAQRQASNPGERGSSPWGQTERNDPSIESDCKKRGRETAASRVMGTGEPQWHSCEATITSRGAKVTHAMVNRWRKNTDTMQGVRISGK